MAWGGAVYEIRREFELMYHGRFKGTHYEAGYKWGKLVERGCPVTRASSAFSTRLSACRICMG